MGGTCFKNHASPPERTLTGLLCTSGLQISSPKRWDEMKDVERRSESRDFGTFCCMIHMHANPPIFSVWGKCNETLAIPRRQCDSESRRTMLLPVAAPACCNGQVGLHTPPDCQYECADRTCCGCWQQFKRARHPCCYLGLHQPLLSTILYSVFLAAIYANHPLQWLLHLEYLRYHASRL